MSAAILQFPAPDWADEESSSAVTEPDGITVFWIGHDHSQNPAYQVRLVKVDALDEDGRWSAVNAEINAREGNIALHNPSEVDDLIAALVRLSMTWKVIEE